VTGDDGDDGAGHVDAGTVHAWLDGQLSPDEAAHVEAHTASCPACSAVVAEARGYIAASTRILNSLDSVPARVLPQARRRRVPGWQLRIAAAAVVMVAGTALVLHQRGGAARIASSIAADRAVAPAGQANHRDVGAPAAPPPAPPGQPTMAAPRASKPMASPPESAALAAKALKKQELSALAKASPPNARRERLADRPDTPMAELDQLRAPSKPQRPAAPAPPVAQSAPLSAPAEKNALEARVPGPLVPATKSKAGTPSVVEGRVVAEDGQTAVGAATVTAGVGGAANEVVTNDSGAFRIAMAADTGTLIVQGPGYRPQQITLASKEDQVTVRLTRDSAAYDSRSAGAGVDADGRQIAGRVVDARERAPIPAAAVLVPGTTIGQTTTDSGAFHLTVPADAKSLSVRRIGYLAQNIPLTPGIRDYVIPMQKDVLQLESQVVTGAATVPSSANATAAVSSQSAARASAPVARITRCTDRVVRVSTAHASATSMDSASIRLSRVPSADTAHPGFVIQPADGGTPAISGTWLPIARDSARVRLIAPQGVIEGRVGCR